MAQQLRNVVARGMGPVGKFVLGAGAAGTFLYNGLYNVEGGHRAVIFNRITGVKEIVIDEGTHFAVPWLERPTIYDIRSRPRNMTSQTGSRDLQTILISVRVLSRPAPGALVEIYRRLGENYDERVLPSIVNEVCKQVVAQFNATDLITQRESVSQMIKEYLVKRAGHFNLILDDVAITEVNFGKEFLQAVEAKQVAQQEAERAKFLVDKALQEKRSIVIKAQGDAKAAELIGEAIKNEPGFIQMRRIKAAKEVADSISRSANRVYLDANGLMLNVMAQEQDVSSK